jgi:hypothetical protein
MVTAIFMAAGGIVSFLGIRNRPPVGKAAASAAQTEQV